MKVCIKHYIDHIDTESTNIVVYVHSYTVHDVSDEKWTMQVYIMYTCSVNRLSDVYTNN